MASLRDVARLTRDRAGEAAPADLQTIIDAALAANDADRARRAVESDLRAWQRRTRPDHLDRAWRRFVATVREIERAPFPTNTRHAVATPGRMRGAETQMTDRSPDNHRTERFEW